MHVSQQGYITMSHTFFCFSCLYFKCISLLHRLPILTYLNSLARAWQQTLPVGSQKDTTVQNSDRCTLLLAPAKIRIWHYTELGKCHHPKYLCICRQPNHWREVRTLCTSLLGGKKINPHDKIKQITTFILFQLRWVVIEYLLFITERRSYEKFPF